ncbi:hypothetical protein BQ8482_400038 [Mesorhizobium delmotii]|uniref:Uncharacterized protein n=1 Tax=Mesorhizobium delmotii TaxID=1631247 RepID=A0A2P9AT14_9HYPH|nr:hypothetical protein BQ8482_400038 [Mesorhizobium delmotii]
MAGDKTGQLLCYLIRTTRVLMTVGRLELDPPELEEYTPFHDQHRAYRCCLLRDVPIGAARFDH